MKLGLTWLKQMHFIHTINSVYEPANLNLTCYKKLNNNYLSIIYNQIVMIKLPLFELENILLLLLLLSNGGKI